MATEVTEMEKVRIGFVGTGFMGQCAHLINYSQLDECQVTAIAEVRPQLGEAVAARYGVKKVYRTHTEMLANEELDGIVASQPFWRHGVLLPDLFEAGVPVFTEKPLSCSVEAGEGILAALQQSGGRHFLGYHKRSDPASLFAREEIRRLKDSGELGAMRYVRILMPAGDYIANGGSHCIRTDEPPPERARDALPADMDEATQRDYSSFVNYYIHQVNLMRYLLGEDYQVSYADPSGVLLAVQSASGIAGTIEMSPYRTSIDWQEEALIAFERGYVKLELPAPLARNRPGTVTLLRDPGEGKVPETVVPQLPWIHAMRQQALHFVRAVRGEAVPLSETAEGLKDLQVARDYIRMLRQ
jgi:predicted dehydrogenase